jgi:hypothetical protein
MFSIVLPVRGMSLHAFALSERHLIALVVAVTQVHQIGGTHIRQVDVPLGVLTGNSDIEGLNLVRVEHCLLHPQKKKSVQLPLLAEYGIMPIVRETLGVSHWGSRSNR